METPKAFFKLSSKPAFLDNGEVNLICRQHILAVVMATCLGFTVAPCAESQLATFTLNAQYGGFLELSAGAPPQTNGQTATVSNTSSGATTMAAPTNAENFASAIDFGDVSGGDGTPIVGGVGLRVRSNTGFRVLASLTSFQATTLRYQGRDVSSNDGGSFIKIWLGPVTATGGRAIAVGRTSVNSLLTGGSTLAALSRGPVSAASTELISGPVASIGGGKDTPDNAIEFPFLLSVPTGFELGAAPGQANGSFSFVVQFGIFGKA